MTEVKLRPSGGLGLFATQKYNVGDVIVKEDAPILLLKPSADAVSLLKSPSKKQGKRKSTSAPSLLDFIVPPSSIPSHQANNFKGMVQIAVAFAQLQPNQSVVERALQLYNPSGGSPREDEIIDVADKALAYLQKNSLDNLKQLAHDSPEMLKKVMLVWACNSFEGGRIYELQSRINHSCNPNAVVVATNDKDSQVIKAAAPIQAGEEVTISYLGLFLYTDTPTRRQELSLAKHFDCQCERCTSTLDVAASIPCPSCHKRSGRYLDEDTQYDDEGSVRYAIPNSSKTIECAHCHETFAEQANKPHDPVQLSRTVSAKVVTYLQKQRSASDDDNVEEEWEEQLLQLSSSVLGARHWATNLLLLMRMDRSLKTMSSNMISSGNPPDFMEVAELVDHLERLVTFINGLHLKLHMGHVLGNVIIGVARMLVALGDAKSKTYASEWLSKIQTDYVPYFESPEMNKVVETLAIAWQKNDDDATMQGEDEYESNKRAKLS